MPKIQTGRFIFDKDDTLSVKDRVLSAAKEYQSKANHKPNLAFINPRLFKETNTLDINQDGFAISVFGDHRIPIHITYIGIGGEECQTEE